MTHDEKLRELLNITDQLLSRFKRQRSLKSYVHADLDDFRSLVRLVVYKHAKNIDINHPRAYIQKIIESRYKNYIRDQTHRFYKEQKALTNSCWPWCISSDVLEKFENFLKERLTSQEYELTLAKSSGITLRRMEEKFDEDICYHTYGNRIKILRGKIEKLEKEFKENQTFPETQYYIDHDNSTAKT